MNRPELIKAVAENSGETQKSVGKVLDSLVQVISDSNEEVKLQGFGTFMHKTREARDNARNPKTGEIVKAEAKTTLRFKPSKTQSKSAK